MNRTLLEISQTKNGILSEILMNWKSHPAEDVILSFSELKRRNVPVNESLQKLMTEFSEHQGKPFSAIEHEFFQSHGTDNYSEYYAAKIKVPEKSDEEKMLADRQRRKAAAELNEKVEKQSNRDVLWGGFFLLGGIIAVWVSFSSGNHGIFGFGAVFLGAVKLLTGLTKSS